MLDLLETIGVFLLYYAVWMVATLLLMMVGYLIVHIFKLILQMFEEML